MRVSVTMFCNRHFTTEEEHPIIDVQDGHRLYEILDSARVPTNDDLWYEYKSSQ